MNKLLLLSYICLKSALAGDFANGFPTYEDFLVEDFYTIINQGETQCWAKAKLVQSYPKERFPWYLKNGRPNPYIGNWIEVAGPLNECSTYVKGRVFRAYTLIKTMEGGVRYILKDKFPQRHSWNSPPYKVNLSKYLLDIDSEYDHKKLETFFKERDESLGITIKISSYLHEDGYLFDHKSEIALGDPPSHCEQKGIYEIRIVDRAGKTLSSCFPSTRYKRDYITTMEVNISPREPKYKNDGSFYSLKLNLPPNAEAYEIVTLKDGKSIAHYPIVTFKRLKYSQYIDLIPTNGWFNLNQKDKILKDADRIDTKLSMKNIKDSLQLLKDFKKVLSAEVKDDYKLVRNEALSKKQILNLIDQDIKELEEETPIHRKKCFWKRYTIKTKLRVLHR